MFSAIIRFSLQRRLFILVATALLTAYGVMIGRGMPIDLLPELQPPMVVVLTEANGFAPEEVEQLVTVPIERAMHGMPGVNWVRSISSAGFSSVRVQFAWGTDVYRDRQLVMERLAVARDRLPHNVEPALAPPASVLGVVLQVALEADEHVSPMDLRDVADWTIRPLLMSVPGVSQVFVVGGDVRQFAVLPNPTAMKQLDVTLDQIESAVSRFGTNSSGGFADVHGAEYIIRNVGRSIKLEDMRSVVVAFRGMQPVPLSQVADVAMFPKVKRGDGSVDGRPTVLMSLVKHPSANSVQVAAAIEDTLREVAPSLPAGVGIGKITYNQADLINDSIGNVEHSLRDAMIIVAIVLLAFLLEPRSTLISLVALPVSLVTTVVTFHLLGLSINVMTLGGIAIAIGALVDDAVVNVENILRRLDENRRAGSPRQTLQVIGEALDEVRSGIVYATFIILLVFVPLFALPDQQGRLFTPLGVAYVVSILASLLTSLTVTPALCAFAFGSRTVSAHGTPGILLRLLQRANGRALTWALDNPLLLLAGTGVLVLVAAASVAALPRSFLPPFNEGTLYVRVLNKPGLSLAESSRLGAVAERIIQGVPEVVTVARRTGRYEDDFDADPVSSNEFPVTIRRDGRSRSEIIGDIRQRLSWLPVELYVTQFLTDRLQVASSGAGGSIVLKIFGEDLATLRTLADSFKARLSSVPGLVDLLVEPQARVPQIRITMDYSRAELFGISPSAVTQALETLSNGNVVSTVVDGNRRIDVLIRLPDADRTTDALAALLVETPSGRVPLSSIATVQETTGPNEILHDNSRRRIALSANVDGADTAEVVARMRAVIAATALPAGYTTNLEGAFQQQEQAQVMIPGLSAIALLLIFILLQQRYQSATLSLIIMGNMPLALIGSAFALWLWGVDLSLASMIGLVAVAGIAVRNGLLKISHFLNLTLHEGVPFGRELIARGCRERLMPVLMTALSAGLALIPLLFASDRPGMEILHPVAVAIFGGLVSSTVLDTLTTPVLFHLFGNKAVRRLMQSRDQSGYAAAETF